MTLPDERYRAVAIARDLLARLINPKLTPRVPVEVRIEARNCLRHFPSEWEMQETANLVPRMFQKEIEPLYKMIKQYENDIEQ